MNLREKIEYDQWQSERGKHEDDPAKAHRASIKGVAVIQDEYFSDVQLSAFEKPGQELKEMIEARKKSEEQFQAALQDARQFLITKGFRK